MDHFPASNWIEFFRGGLTDAEAAPLQTHLDNGCAECLKSAQTWRLVIELLSKESQYQPPEEVVLQVKSAKLPETRYKWFAKLADFANLTFDSLKQPSLAMVRSSTQAGRQLVHKADPFIIDVRAESDSFGKTSFLTGQILNSEDPGLSTSDFEVILLSGDRLVERTHTSPSGEFDFELASQTKLQLFIKVGRERLIGIALEGLDA